MKKAITMLFALVFSVNLCAITITDDFNSGISDSLWTKTHIDASGSNWTIQAPDTSGQLCFSKNADSGSPYDFVKAELESKFVVNGDFSASIDFNLLNFPSNCSTGWNVAMLRVVTNGSYFGILRLSSKNIGVQLLKGNSSFTNDIGTIADSTASGKFILMRQDATMSAWIDRGNGMTFVGSETRSEYLGAATVYLQAYQIGSPRPATALDVRYDNFVAIPEPATLSLLAIGGIALLRKRKA